MRSPRHWVRQGRALISMARLHAVHRPSCFPQVGNALQLQRADSKEMKLKQMEADKEARKDPNWKAKVANSANKSGMSWHGLP